MTSGNSVHDHDNELWRVISHPDRPGMYLGIGLTRSGARITITSDNRELLAQRLIEMQMPDEGGAVFLAAWKRGVRLAGPELFHCDAPSIDEATHKEQLRPRWDKVEVYIRGGCSRWERIFLIEMCSFYNDDWMREQKRLLRLPRLSFGTAAIGLDQDRRQVLADLLANYRGW